MEPMPGTSRQPQHFQLWGKHRGQPLSRFRVGISGHYQRLLSRVLAHRGWRFSQLLKNCGQTAFAFAKALKVGRDWTHWTRDENLLESVRKQLGNLIAAPIAVPDWRKKWQTWYHSPL